MSLDWRNVWFQTHWLIGITAGVVLAIVGLTGALLSFEEEILRALNPQLTTVEPAGRARLLPGDMVRVAQSAEPPRRVTSLQIGADPSSTVRLMMIDDSRAAGPNAGAGGGPPARRGTPLYLDPFTGAALGSERRGEATLHVIEDVHRRLAGGDTGKLIVGISTTLLLVLAGTGIYLRWPRVASSLRAWLTFRWALRGRTFLWHLHAVVGTWVLLLYLLASLTGLYWSFEWYRDGLFAMTGAPRPQQAGATPPQGGAGPRAEADGMRPKKGGEHNGASRPGDPTGRAPRPEDTNERAPRDVGATIDPSQVTAAWLAFAQAAPNYETATLTLPKSAQQPVELRYLEVDTPHPRAYNRMTIDGASGAVLTHERYEDKPFGHRVMGSMFALHSGSFFGVAGVLAVMLASLCMPLFAVTGWMMYLKRRRARNAGVVEEVAGAAGIEPATR